MPGSGLSARAGFAATKSDGIDLIQVTSDCSEEPVKSPNPMEESAPIRLDLRDLTCPGTASGSEAAPSSAEFRPSTSQAFHSSLSPPTAGAVALLAADQDALNMNDIKKINRLRPST